MPQPSRQKSFANHQLVWCLLFVFAFLISAFTPLTANAFTPLTTKSFSAAHLQKMAVSGARDYDPQSGRFLSPDPLGHSSSTTLYDYANGDPVNGLDPDGRFGKNTLDTSSLSPELQNFTENYGSDYSQQGDWAAALDPQGAADFQYAKEHPLSDYDIASMGGGLLSGKPFNFEDFIDNTAEAVGNAIGLTSLVNNISIIATGNDINGLPTDRTDGIGNLLAPTPDKLLTAAMFAAPELEAGALAARGSLYLETSTSRSIAADILAQVRNADFSTPANGAVFWTGFKYGNQTAAMDWAAANEKYTIEMTEGGQWLKSLDLYGENPPVSRNDADVIWRVASEQFASGASGSVNAFTKGTEADISKTFYGIELPILKRNPNVNSKITYRGY